MCRRMTVQPSQVERVVLVDRILQPLAGTELGLVRFPDLHRLAGPRVTTSGCLALRYGESPEPDETDFIATLQRVCDGVEDTLDGLAGVPPAEAGGLSDRTDKLLLVHVVRTPVRGIAAAAIPI